MDFSGIISAVLVIVGILLVRNITNVLPSLIGCLLRWKECLNLEDSVKSGIDRNIFAAYMILPFCLTASEYRLYDPEFLAGMPHFAYFACICGVFAGFDLLRFLASRTIRHPKVGDKIFRAGFRTSASFFCIMSSIVLIAAGISSFSGASEETTKSILLYCILAVYLVFLFRKFQIFRNSCSFFTAFLYLCVLEILPGVILVLTAVFL